MPTIGSYWITLHPFPKSHNLLIIFWFSCKKLQAKRGVAAKSAGPWELEPWPRSRERIHVEHRGGHVEHSQRTWSGWPPVIPNRLWSSSDLNIPSPLPKWNPTTFVFWKENKRFMLVAHMRPTRGSPASGYLGLLADTCHQGSYKNWCLKCLKWLKYIEILVFTQLLPDWFWMKKESDVRYAAVITETTVHHWDSHGPSGASLPGLAGHCPMCPWHPCWVCWYIGHVNWEIIC